MQWVMINRLLRLMWPKLTTAILKEVISLAKPILQQVFIHVSKPPWQSPDTKPAA
jgi:hypothetical protein